MHGQKNIKFCRDVWSVLTSKRTRPAWKLKHYIGSSVEEEIFRPD